MRVNAADAPTSRSTVLVVDDDKAVRESLRRSLEFNGYAVALATDGAEALAGGASLDAESFASIVRAAG